MSNSSTSPKDPIKLKESQGIFQPCREDEKTYEVKPINLNNAEEFDIARARFKGLDETTREELLELHGVDPEDAAHDLTYKQYWQKIAEIIFEGFPKGQNLNLDVGVMNRARSYFLSSDR